MSSYDVKLSQPRPQGSSLGMRLKRWNSVFTRLRFRERVHFPLSKSFLTQAIDHPISSCTL